MVSVNSKFGTEISAEDVRETLTFFDDWEDRYRYVIDLGKQLPAMPEEQKVEKYLVRGCQSQVWLIARPENTQLFFEVDSDAHIVRGLISILMCVYNSKTPAEILDYDIESYFKDLELFSHLSATRGNGLRAMVGRIKQAARESMTGPRTL